MFATDLKARDNNTLCFNTFETTNFKGVLEECVRKSMISKFFHFWNNRFCLTFYNIYKISPRLSEKFTLSSKQYCIVKKMKNKIQILIFRDLSMTRAQCFSNMHGFFQFLRHMPVANKFFRNLNQMKLG